jgi:cytochrome b
MRVRVRIWDLPTRVFHLALLLGVLLADVTARVGAQWMVWHLRIGSALGILLLFRLGWGLVGGRWSRFSGFGLTVPRMTAYLQGRIDGGPGHNPLGALSVLAMLILLVVQVVSGMLTDDEVSYAGPWVERVSAELSQRATNWHTHAGQAWVLSLVALHLAAVAFHQFLKSRDLIGPMWHGDRCSDEWHDCPVEPSRDDSGSRVLALLVLGVCAVLWLFVLRGWPG